MKSLFLKTLVLVLAAGGVSAVAANTSPLNDDDEVAVFLHSVSSDERSGEAIRVRAAICVDFNKCKEFTITPVIKVGAGESIDFDKKDLKARRSQVFSGKELNAKIAALAAEKKVANPKPQIAVMMVRVDRNEKVLDKSDSSYLDFPQKDASGEVAKGAKVGVLKNTVELKLNNLEVKASVAINRKVKN